jgi:uncharacterized protein GlcG (DUF336 family)
VRNSGAILLALLLAACGGSGGGSPPAPPVAAAPERLTVTDVERIVSRAVAEAQARNARAQVAVVDRVGNVLAVYAMAGRARHGLGGCGSARARRSRDPRGASAGTARRDRQGDHRRLSLVAGECLLDAHRRADRAGALQSRRVGAAGRAALRRAVLAAHLLGRDAPGRAWQRGSEAIAPRTCRGSGRASALQERHAGRGIGIEADGHYGIDAGFGDIDDNLEERVAVAGTFGLAAPADIRGERITADGRTFRFVDSESLMSDPAAAPPGPPGAYAPVAGYFDGVVREGAAYGSTSSGIRPAEGTLAPFGAWVLADAAGAERFPPRDASDNRLARADVEAILAEALAVARHARAQIRRPLGSAAQVTVAVVDTNGVIVGLVRTADGPVFGIDVAVQKARGRDVPVASAGARRSRRLAARGVSRWHAVAHRKLRDPLAGLRRCRCARRDGGVERARDSATCIGPFFPRWHRWDTGRPALDPRSRCGARSTWACSSTW